MIYFLQEIGKKSIETPSVSTSKSSTKNILSTAKEIFTPFSFYQGKTNVLNFSLKFIEITIRKS